MLGVSMDTALARIESRGEIFIQDCAYAGDQFMANRPLHELFHHSTLFTNDTETFSMEFSGDSGTEICNQPLAMPTISQESEQTACASDTGQYFVNWNYISFVNAGGQPLGAGNIGHPMHGTDVCGSGVIWPYMISATPETFQIANKMTDVPDKVNTSAGTSGNKSLAGIFGNSVKGMNNYAPSKELMILDPYSDRIPANRGNKSTCDYIGGCNKAPVLKDMSILEKMWWNAHAGSKMDLAYTGMMSHPTAIDPNKDAYKVIPMPAMSKVINESLNMTRPGTNITRKLWDI
jgi:hypothetical protein